MYSESKIATDDADEFVQWDLSADLVELDLNEIRLGRGFLRASISEFFNGVTADWLPLFHSLGAKVELEAVEVGLYFPNNNFSRLTTFEAEGVLNVLGMDDNAQAAIIGMVETGIDGVKAEIVIEYLERRLLSSFTRYWTGAGTLDCFFHQSEVVEEVELVGAACCKLVINDKPLEIWFGLGQKVVDKIDLSWREYVLQQVEEVNGSVDSQAVATVSVELAELAVSPVMLIDYMRSGTTIALSAPVSSRVLVRVNDQPWANGELSRFNGRFAVKLLDFDVVYERAEAGMTRVQVELGNAELSMEAIYEHQQVGVCLLLPAPVRPNASLIISGENVASAVVGQINDQFALNVLPK